MSSTAEILSFVSLGALATVFAAEDLLDTRKPVFPVEVDAEVAKILVDLEDRGEDICKGSSDLDEWGKVRAAEMNELGLGDAGETEIRNSYDGDEIGCSVVIGFFVGDAPFQATWYLDYHNDGVAIFAADPWWGTDSYFPVDLPKDSCDCEMGDLVEGL